MVFVIWMDASGMADSWRANSSVDASSSSAGNRRFTKPQSFIWAAGILPPMNSSSLARWAPTSSGSIFIMPISGMMPIWQKAGTNWARSLAQTRSLARARAKAPPTA